jgi:hypothetical protein
MPHKLRQPAMSSSSSQPKVDLTPAVNPLMQILVSSSSQLHKTTPRQVLNPFTRSAKKQKTAKDHSLTALTHTSISLSSQLEKALEWSHQKPDNKKQGTTADGQKRSQSQTSIASYLMPSLNVPLEKTPKIIYEKEEQNEK